jgi:hypothetical protein
MTMRKTLVLATLGGFLLPGSALAAPCYNLAQREPHTLTGFLDYAVFPGPPNFEDVQKGDTPEPTYVLRLASPICLTGDPDFAEPSRMFRAVQVVGSEATFPLLRANVRHQVTVGLANPMAAETGHHHEPLVAWVTSIRLAQDPAMSLTDEYGTAATTIRAFYDALHAGQGATASSYVVPEKRRLAAFSPDALARYYGNMASPITMIDIVQRSANTFLVHYRYGTRTRTCDAHSTITTESRNGRNFIQAIRPVEGC